MIDEELLSKFDRIQDLPVSEEMLGAYLEGNLSDAEIDDMEMMLQYHPDINNIYSEVLHTLDSTDYIDDGFNDFNSLGVSDSIISSELVGITDDFTIPYDLLSDLVLPNIDNEANGLDINCTNDDGDFGFDLKSDDHFDLNI